MALPSSNVKVSLFILQWSCLLFSFYFVGVASQSTNVDGSIITASANATCSERNLSDGGRWGCVRRGWMSSPGQRGTYNLLFSCAITVALAVWSSVILNIQMTPDAIKNRIAMDRLYAAKNRTGSAGENPTPGPHSPATISSTSPDTPQSAGAAEEKGTRAKIKACLRYLWYKLRIQLDRHHGFRWKYKTLWAALSVIVPELVFVVSLDEYLTASDTLKALQRRNEKYPEEEVKACKEIFQEWNTTMGLYASTGGFYVRLCEDGPESNIGSQSLVHRCCAVTRMRADYLKNSQNRQVDPKPRRVLTSHGVVYIAKLVDKLRSCKDGSYCKQGSQPSELQASEKDLQPCTCSADAERLKAQFEDVSPEIIADLSKVDWVGRTLFLVQGAWMVIQCIARYSAHYPITLLELQSASHVGLAMVQYVVWWVKPIDITVMTPLTLTRTQYDRMLKEKTPDRTSHIRLPTYYAELFGPVKDIEMGDRNESRSNPSWIRRQFRELLDMSHVENSHTFYLTSQATLAKSGYQQLTGRLGLANKPIKGMFTSVTMQLLNWHRWPRAAMLWFTMVTFYGALNVCAWNWYFPTRTELLLWRICSVATAVGLTVYLLDLLTCMTYIWIRVLALKHRDAEKRGQPVPEIGRVWKKVYQIICSDWMLALFRVKLAMTIISVWAGTLPWLLAKLFLALESVLSLRELPEGAFTLVKWTTFVPHLG